MSAALLRPVQTPSAQVLAVWRAMPGAYLVLGRASGPMPKSGSARVAGQSGAHGMFRTFFWPLGDTPAVGYLTVVRLPDRAIIGGEPELVLRGARGGDRDFAIRLLPGCEEQEFGRDLASLAGGSAASVARFILDLIRPEAEVDLRRPILLLETFMQHAAHHEGCVELILNIPSRILLLQGWGPPTGDEVEIVLTSCGVMRHRLQVGEFIRNDIQPPLLGSVLALPVELSSELARVQSIFLLTPNLILCRRLLDTRVIEPVASSGQIRHLLPRLQCSAMLRSSLREALRPQYEGVDTLNNSQRPVRAALDWAASSVTTGLFLSGWLLDPTGSVDRVEYCARETTTRLDDVCVRINREDVLLAFKNDPSFAKNTNLDIGFAVHVPAGATVEGAPHLRITFRDDDVAFLPVVAKSIAQPELRAKLCRSVDMHKPSGIEIVEHHLAPFLAKSEPQDLTTSRIVLGGPLDRRHAIVIPLMSACLPRAAIANLLQDPLSSQEELIFVCGPDWNTAHFDALIERIRFYEVPATIVALSEARGPIDALLAAALKTDAETFLIVSMSASSLHPDSRQELRDGSFGADAVCPTVLYEDGSIKFAGTSTLDFTERSPFTRIHARWAGLSGENVGAQDATDSIGGTLECCLLTRAALPSAELARHYATKPGQEAAFFSELNALGARVAWLPKVFVSTADEYAPDTNVEVSALVDLWSLRANWGSDTCAS